MKAVNRSRMVIVAVAALFFIPVLVAMFLNSSWSAWAPAATKNFGNLVQPPLLTAPFQSQTDDRIWTLALDGRGGCGESCLDHVNLLSQIERAMGRHAARTRRALLIDPQDPAATTLGQRDPQLQLVTDPGQSGLAEAWLAEISSRGAFIVDPQGYLIMTYTAPLDGTGIRKDLNHLLKWTDDS